MSLVEYTLDGKIDKVERALWRIKQFAPVENGLQDKPYYVAYSGGKDSDVIRILCQLAGVKHELWHNHTTVDAPETVYYVRSIPGIRINYPDRSMWRLIAEKRMPPTRVMRYCCYELKEGGGTGRFVMTGVRWAESARRKKSRGSAEIIASTRQRSLILNADNDEHRKQFEICQLKGKRVINPIVDWDDDDVWEFLRHYGCQSNPLYQCGYTRVGCVGCPMAGRKKQIEEFERYPKYKENYIRAFDRMVKKRLEDGLETEWHDGEECFAWWTSPKAEDPLAGQEIMEDYL